MAGLEPALLDYLDGHFTALHAEIREVRDAAAAARNGATAAQSAIDGHLAPANPCGKQIRGMEEHLKEWHSFIKAATFFGATVGGTVGIVQAIRYFGH